MASPPVADVCSLLVLPKELEFTGPFDKNIQKSISITNPNDKKILFKLKSKTPDHYTVTPNHGLLKPKDTKEITITALSGKDKQADSRAGLLVQYVCVDSAKKINDFKAEFESLQKDLKHLKVPCKFIDPASRTSGSGVKEPEPSRESAASPTQNAALLNDQAWIKQHELNQQIQIYRQRHERALEEIRALNQDFTDAKENVLALEKTCLDHKQRIHELESENRQLQDDVRQLQNQNRQLQQDEVNTKLRLGEVAEEKFKLEQRLEELHKSYNNY